MGYIKRPKKKPIRRIGPPVWYSKDKNIKRFMQFDKAKEWSLKTGKSVFMKVR